MRWSSSCVANSAQVGGRDLRTETARTRKSAHLFLDVDATACTAHHCNRPGHEWCRVQSRRRSGSGIRSCTRETCARSGQSGTRTRCHATDCTRLRGSPGGATRRALCATGASSDSRRVSLKHLCERSLLPRRLPVQLTNDSDVIAFRSLM